MSDPNTIFEMIFDDKPLEGSHDEVKEIIAKDVPKFEQEIMRISNSHFLEWAQNIQNSSKLILFDNVSYYFSLFTKIIDLIPTFFPEDSQAFLLVIQPFLTNIIKDANIMEYVSLAICLQIENLVEKNEIDEAESEKEMGRINGIFAILKSFHLLEAAKNDIMNYNFNFTNNLIFDSENIVNYIIQSFTRYRNAAIIFRKIFVDHECISKLLHITFNQLIKSKMSKMTDGVQPPIGKLLLTPFLSWICEEYEMQKFEMTEIYESCSNFVYDAILMYTRGKNDQIGSLLKFIEDVTQNYSSAFISLNGSMNCLESNIRSALNDPRLKFSYNFAAFLDSHMENAFIEKKNIWHDFLPKDENHSHCCHHQTDSIAQSAFLKALMRIENINIFCDYFKNSLISLTATYGPSIQNVVQPMLDIIKLATGRFLMFTPDQQNQQKQQHFHDHNCNEIGGFNNPCLAQREPEMVPEVTQVEAQIELNAKKYSVFTDFLTMQILNAIAENSKLKMNEILQKVKGNQNDIENRVITLSDYLLFNDDEGFYYFDESFESDNDYIRIPPFFEEMKGKFDQEKTDLIKRKAIAAIQTKINEPMKTFIYDCFLMIKRKVRPDTAMILDLLDDFVEENFVKIEENAVILIEKKKE
ncbi:hypothetical protein TRFO_31635 [Tritrichomonas foetus]|uniref:Uncharacterized protein n=1 Tax=Tritrichomonas foetus TaxID=1144522 RepID=A0A1J4JVI4_9EUKA|nr:hypothetical protein TRFO_31635 [Tritrichomonas foetus]|eukprot:OHT01534.1 hypothetical protein TRFO_31635 [Tritrichomonas foetus]